MGPAVIDTPPAERDAVVAPKSERVDLSWLVLLAVGHAVTDSYSQSLLSPMFPDLRRQLGLSMVQVGALPLMMGLSASLGQPLLGWVSDRRPRWCLVALGPLIAASVIGWIGHVRSFAELALLLFIAGLGIGAYHPQAAALARDAGRGGSLAMSAFTVGGNVGYGLAPMLGGFYLIWFGLSHLYYTAAPAVLFAGFMALMFYTRPPEHAHSRRARELSAGKGQPVALAALTATVVVRTAVQVGMMTFLPFMVSQKFPVALQAGMKGATVSAFLLSSAIAGPLGGHLSDRFGRRSVMIWSFALAPWPLLLAFGVSGAGFIALLAAGAFLLMLPHPGNVVMAQEFMPRSAGIAASLITGLAAGLAQILALPLGRVAEVTSTATALSALCFVPLLGIPLVLLIPAEARGGKSYGGS